jgi:hypothetical protein
MPPSPPLASVLAILRLLIATVPDVTVSPGYKVAPEIVLPLPSIVMLLDTAGRRPVSTMTLSGAMLILSPFLALFNALTNDA